MITAYSQTRNQNMSVVSVTSDLAGIIYYFWYLAGAFVAATQRNAYTFLLQPGEQARVDVIDTNDPDFDPIAHAQAGYPARRSIHWVKSQDADASSYRVEQRKDAGAWSTIGIIYASPEKWSHVLLSPILEDLAVYEWRITPVDQAGNDGTAIALSAETIVRTPDAPNFAVAFSQTTGRVTFSEVA
jgi:hypothetical protein